MSFTDNTQEVSPDRSEILKCLSTADTSNMISASQDSIAVLESLDDFFKVPNDVEQAARSLVKEVGIEMAAKKLGYSTNNYFNLVMAGRLIMEDLVSKVPSNIIDYVKGLSQRLGEDIKGYMIANATSLQEVIDRYAWCNYRYDYISANSMISLYLSRAKHGGSVAESPAFMFMRIAVQLHHHSGLQHVIKCFEELAKNEYTVASPTMFNAGMKRPQMSSCFILSIGDSLDKILGAVYNAGMISKFTGGLGIDVSQIRHSEIDGVGMASGLTPMLRIFNDLLRYVDQGGGKRKGAATIFLTPHHIDVLDFINLVNPIGDHNSRTHDLNLCLWLPWIFWQRVDEDGDWTTFCPAKAPKLNNLYGRDYEKQYVEYENDPSVDPKYRHTMKARELLKEILVMQRRSGKLFLMNRCSANFKSAHKHVGYIRSSNLCVTGDTRILTRDGYHPIESKVGQEVEVWNGQRWSTTTVEKTSDELRHIFRVNLQDGRSLKCTPNHIFLVQPREKTPAPHILDSKRETGHYLNVQRRMAVDLRPGDILETCDFPVVDYQVPETSHSNIPWRASLEDRCKWFSRILDNSELLEDRSLTVTTKYATELQLFLQTLGVQSTVGDDNQLCINQYYQSKLYHLGCRPQDVHLDQTTYTSYSIGCPVVASVDYNMTPALETFCFKEQENHAGVFEGILTGQCLEILEYTDDEVINVCNLSSINLDRVVPQRHTQPPQDLAEALSRIDFKTLGKNAASCVCNLNRVIDNNFYPLDVDDGDKLVRGPIHKTNARFRAIGLGVNGLSEMFNRVDIPYVTEIAGKLDETVTACIYYNSLISSVQLSILEGKCDVFDGSPYAQGKLQFDLWDEEYIERWGAEGKPHPSWSRQDLVPLEPTIWRQKHINLYNNFGEVIDTIAPSWDDVKRVVIKYGMRNSLLLAYMPTASTAKVLRNSESTESLTAGIYSVNLIHGSYPMVNRYMVFDLTDIGLWSDNAVQYLRANNGRLTGFRKYIEHCGDEVSQEHLDRLDHLELKYKTMAESSQKEVIFRAARRGKYIDQSQSTSLFMSDANDNILGAAHKISNKLGNKTLMYYLHTDPPNDPAKLSVDPKVIQYINQRDNISSTPEREPRYICTDDICLSCQ